MFSGRTKGCFESPPYLDQVANQAGSAVFFINVIFLYLTYKAVVREGAISCRINIFEAFMNNTINQYGETDEGLRRGNPLSLCADR